MGGTAFLGGGGSPLLGSLGGGGSPLLGGLGGNSLTKSRTDVEYFQSPEQRAVYQSLLPMIKRLGRRQDLYDVPSFSSAMETISPAITPALWKPYEEAEERLLDVLQSRGQLGAPGAGLSGAASTGLGEFYSQAAKNIGMQTYFKALPLWEAQVQQQMLPWQIMPGLLGGTYSTGLADYKPSLMSQLLPIAGTAAGGFGGPMGAQMGGQAGSAIGQTYF